jgi:hypothetical protein
VVWHADGRLPLVSSLDHVSFDARCHPVLLQLVSMAVLGVEIGRRTRRWPTVWTLAVLCGGLSAATMAGNRCNRRRRWPWATATSMALPLSDRTRTRLFR